MNTPLYFQLNRSIHMAFRMLLIASILSVQPAAAQGLKPGFDPNEYVHLLSVTSEQVYEDYHPTDTSAYWSRYPKKAGSIPPPYGYRMVYHAPESGLMNRWALWLGSDSVGIICIRGTVNRMESWMENFYAAMVPATGVLHLNSGQAFSYRLASNPRAAVHAGWLLGMASMAPSIVRHINDWHKKGIRRFIIFGHSQGAAIAFLLRSYLYYLPESELPRDIQIKTYCSAAPKPGNQYYAYDFDRITAGGWGLRVVSDLDWVPESPLGTQTVEDFNSVNPFVHIKPALRKSPWLIRLYAGYVYHRLRHSTEKSNHQLRSVLGTRMYKMIHHYLPAFQQPEYARSMNYLPAGEPVVLMPYPGFEKEFPETSNDVFIYHGLLAYYLMTLHQFSL